MPQISSDALLFTCLDRDPNHSFLGNGTCLPRCQHEIMHLHAAKCQRNISPKFIQMSTDVTKCETPFPFLVQTAIFALYKIFIRTPTNDNRVFKFRY